MKTGVSSLVGQRYFYYLRIGERSQEHEIQGVRSLVQFDQSRTPLVVFTSGLTFPISSDPLSSHLIVRSRSTQSFCRLETIKYARTSVWDSS
jgi:hypothetical protein